LAQKNCARRCTKDNDPGKELFAWPDFSPELGNEDMTTRARMGQTARSDSKSSVNRPALDVLTVSDRAPFWAEIVACLGASAGIRLVGLLPRAATARQFSRAQADVVIVDCGPIAVEGIELLRRLKSQVPAVRSLFVADSVDLAFVSEAIQSGAQGIFLRPLSAPELLPAFPLVARGGFCLPSRTVQSLVGSHPELMDYQAKQHANLTPREYEILRLQAEGLAYKQIAAKLNVSEHTVNNHLYAVRQKLGVHTAIEAINRLSSRNPG
jgi:DNA-binding NarL/FixJ family response regulator